MLHERLHGTVSVPKEAKKGLKEARFVKRIPSQKRIFIVGLPVAWTIDMTANPLVGKTVVASAAGYIAEYQYEPGKGLRLVKTHIVTYKLEELKQKISELGLWDAVNKAGKTVREVIGGG